MKLEEIKIERKYHNCLSLFSIAHCQKMHFFLIFIATTECFDDFDGLKRERRDLSTLNRHGNNIFNHRHMGGPRPSSGSKFFKTKSLDSAKGINF